MRFAYFITNHGFGHLMRELPVMAELIRRGHKVTVVTGKEHAAVTDNYLGGKADLIVDDTDAGLIVYPGTILIDTDSTVKRIEEHIAKWDRLIKESVDADCYIVDICPWAVIAAKKKGIPCFLMTNFTWIEQYEPFVPDELLNIYKDAYRQADKIIFFDLANEASRAFFKEGFEAGFSARPFDPEKVKAIRESHDKPIVLITCGASNSGFDFDIDVSELPYSFIVTRSLKLIGDNVEYLDPKINNTQDYVAAADYCIAKAGYSTVSEFVTAGVHTALLERDDTAEDTMTINQLKDRKLAISIKVDELKDIGRVIEKMDAFDWSDKVYPNDYSHIADIIEKNI
ncbi:UDP-N-acetylglucosamine:LPS N-acetylglucosamine transferase [Ruminococcaceae bacterium R-25]|nr:UDP-N-acetylglucosamine:LPS N-acetylglucosamine transferase [Ruminococcaceae bacterium R-25]SUQ11396.1 UDP-N-acetylglucosamine:LPS N-acetylglucosamine transferase [Oscillospiraceae bacterium]